MKKIYQLIFKKKLLILLTLLSSYCHFSYSQEQKWTQYEEPLTIRMEKSSKIVQESEFIFQGKFISESVQHTADPNLSIIKTIFQVQYVYKGNLQLGKVMIERKAPVPHWITEKYIGNDGKEYEMEKGYGFVSHSRSNRFSLTRSAIFFCKLGESTQHLNDSIDNKRILEFANSRFSTVSFANYNPEFEFFEMGGLNDLKFKIKDDFYKFLQESDKTIVLPPSARERVVNDSILHQLQRERYKKFIDSVNKEKLIRYNDSKGELKKNSGNINYSISNQKITTTGTERFYEFDVYALVDQPNKFLQSSILTFTYNTAAFGTNVVLNNNVTLTKGSVFGNNYLPAVGGSINEISFKLDYLQFQARYQLPTTPVLLYTLKIKFNPSGCGKNSALAFVYLQQLANNSIYATSATGFTTLNYANVTSSPVLGFTLVCPVMTISTNLASIPDIIAGNKKLITIIGTNFGPNKGKVLFKDANIGGVGGGTLDGFMLGIEPSYIQSWSSTQIVVEVPSYVKEGYEGDDLGCAGSGLIKIKNVYGDSIISNSALRIKSSFLNFANFTDLPNSPVDKFYLTNTNCINGRVFTLHTSFQNNAAAVSAVETALQRWSNHVGITLMLERNADSSIRYLNNTTDASRNIIYFKSNLDVAMLNEPVRSSVCSPKKYYYNKVNIAINDALNWFYPIGVDLPPLSYDFFAIILHELGHTLGLDHDINLTNANLFTNLMHWQGAYVSNPIPFTSRPDLINASTSTNAKAAAVMHVAASKAITLCSAATTANIKPLSSNNSIIKFLGINTNPPNTATLGCGINSITLSSTESTNNEWSKNGSIISTNPSITINTDGVYTLRNRNANCTVASLPASLRIRTVVCVPNDPPNPNFTIYPNPSNSNLTIDYDLSGDLSNTKAIIRVIDLLGKVIFKTSLNNENRFINLEFPELANGIYSVSLLVDDAIVSSKLLTIQK